MQLFHGTTDASADDHTVILIIPLDLEALLPLKYLVGGAEGAACPELNAKKTTRITGTRYPKKHWQIVGAAASDSGT